MIGAHSTDYDDSERIAAALVDAGERGRAVRICGSGSKAWRYPVLGGTSASDSAAAGSADADLVTVSEHRGICHYAPDELVLEARAGTPLVDIERLLAQHDQMLAFEPPRFAGGGTLGGAVATGLSGPSRPWRGSLRDAVLGVEMVNGLGERLHFGGRVVKNVAGYDLSRLQVGAFGTFGALLRVCVRVMPRPLASQTLALECTVEQALEQMAGWSQQPLPLTGSRFEQDVLRVRLEGAPDAVRAAKMRIGGEVVADQNDWEALRDFRLARFDLDPENLYRAVVPVGTSVLAEDASGLLEWGGAVRWYQAPGADLVAQVTAAGGWLCPYSRPDLGRTDDHTQRVAARLRQAFDPQGICNPHVVGAAGANDAY